MDASSTVETGYDWGNLIVQGVIAVATILTLIWAIRVGRGESKRASDERNERQAFEERAQATKISAWEHQRTELKNGEPVGAIPSQTDYDYRDVVERRRIYVHNGSDAPVYDVAVRYYDWTRPDDEDGEADTTWAHAILPPGANARSREVPAVANCGAIAEDVALEVEFRDGSGRYWLRDDSGILHRKSDLDSLNTWDRVLRRRMEVEGQPRAARNQDANRSPETPDSPT